MVQAVKIAIFSRDSNPAIDSPLFYASKDRFTLLLSTAQILVIGKNRAQFVCEQRDPVRIARRRVFVDGRDEGRSWRKTHSGAVMVMQLVAGGGAKPKPTPVSPSNARHGVAAFLRAD